MAALGLRLPRLFLFAAMAAPGLPSVPGLPRRLPAVPAAAPGRAMAGHNRWSKVRHVKGPRDAERSLLFQRLARLLRAAAKEGGPDPAHNSALASLLQQCRNHNVPKATIEAALRPARAPPGSGSRCLLAARGPSGSALLLEVMTSDPRGCQRRLGEILGQHGGSLSEAAQGEFQAMGVVRVSSRDSNDLPVAMEAALEAAVVAGAQDVVATGQDVVATAQDGVATAQDGVTTGQDGVATAQDVVATAQDRVATGQDGVATAQDVVATAQDRVATAQDVVATGQDGVATAQDGVTTAQDGVATGQDGVAEAEGELKFLCDPSALRSVRQSLQAAGLRPLSASVQFVPRTPLALPKGSRVEAERLLQALAECPEVIRLYHNLQERPEGSPGGHLGTEASRGHLGEAPRGHSGAEAPRGHSGVAPRGHSSRPAGQ